MGPIAEVPAMKRIIMAHRLHHTEKYGGVPYGMFFGPQVRELCTAVLAVHGALLPSKPGA